MPDMGSFTAIAPLIFIFAIMYFLLIRPQQQRLKQHKQMVDNVRRGDVVVTAGGIVGKVTKVSDAYVGVEISEGTEITIQKAAVTTILPKGTIKSL